LRDRRDARRLGAQPHRRDRLARERPVVMLVDRLWLRRPIGLPPFSF
jgi:hypothetical protein